MGGEDAATESTETESAQIGEIDLDDNETRNKIIVKAIEC
tara:strand:- start:718 stop:837 length:120 start_codon:yes stop_codon:yes gene_type:complete